MNEGVTSRLEEIVELANSNTPAAIVWFKLRSTLGEGIKNLKEVKLEGKTPGNELLMAALLLLLNPKLEIQATHLDEMDLKIVRAVIESGVWEAPVIIEYFTLLSAGFKRVKDKLGVFLVPDGVEVNSNYLILDWGRQNQPTDPWFFSVAGYSRKFDVPIVERLIEREVPGVFMAGFAEVVVRGRVFRRLVSFEPLCEVESLAENSVGDLKPRIVVDEPVFLFEGVESWWDSDGEHIARFWFVGSVFDGWFYYYTERAEGVLWRVDARLVGVHFDEEVSAWEVVYQSIKGRSMNVRFYVTEEVLEKLKKHPKTKTTVLLCLRG